MFSTCAQKLGEGLSAVIDLLNPECIVIGSLFGRCHDLLWEKTAAVIRAEALARSAEVCRIVPAALGESIGDYAALAAATETEE